MRVLIIADPVIPVPPSGYGGVERVVFSLARGIHEQGHQVMVMAGPGSYGNWPVIIHRAPDNRHWLSRAWRKLWFQILSLKCAYSCDVVLSSGRLDYLWIFLRLNWPIIQTFHHPIHESELDLLQDWGQLTRFVSLSDAQRDHLAPGLWTTVYNGVSVEKFEFSKTFGKYLAFVGRFHPNKGAHIAIDVARKAGYPLKIAASPPRDEIEQSYYDSLIAPQLGGAIEFIGEVGHDAKVQLLKSARALLFPIQWDEPFGLVMVESLACGTPVIAFNRGAVPEVIEHGCTGMICDTADEMVAAVKSVDTLDRARCRAVCEERFSERRMVQDYLNIARELVSPRAKKSLC